MKHKTLWSTILMLAVATTAVSAAVEDEAEPTRGEKRLARIMEKYEATGEVKSCIPLRFLRDTTVIDDQTIFFSTVGKKGYMMHLPNRCPRLATEERFAYKTSIGQLCSLDIITVLDSFGHEWGSCGLGKFEEMSKKPKADDDDDDEVEGEPGQ